MFCQVISCRVVSCRVVSCHVMSCHVMSCHVMSGHVMTCMVRYIVLIENVLHHKLLGGLHDGQVVLMLRHLFFVLILITNCASMLQGLLSLLRCMVCFSICHLTREGVQQAMLSICAIIETACLVYFTLVCLASSSTIYFTCFACFQSCPKTSSQPRTRFYCP